MLYVRETLVKQHTEEPETFYDRDRVTIHLQLRVFAVPFPVAKVHTGCLRGREGKSVGGSPPRQFVNVELNSSFRGDCQGC